MPFSGITVCMIFRILLVLSLVVAAMHARADATGINDCTPTPQLFNHSYPGNKRIISSNDLIEPTGKGVYADGDYLHIRGQVLDSNCLPVFNARVELWQNNGEGRAVVAGNRSLATPNPTFAGTGVAFTDRGGHFSFETIYPGTRNSLAPHVHLGITHPDYRRWAGALYFDGEPLNQDDYRLMRLSESRRSPILMQLDTVSRHFDGSRAPKTVATTRVVIPGSSPWRRF